MAIIDGEWNGQDPAVVFAALSGLIDRPKWHSDAACREHPELNWFPHRGEPQTAQLAVCDACLVRTECAAAGAFEHDGIWGGQSGRGRRRELSATPAGLRPPRKPLVVGTREPMPVSARTAAHSAYMRGYRARVRAGKVA